MAWTAAGRPVGGDSFWQVPCHFCNNGSMTRLRGLAHAAAAGDARCPMRLGIRNLNVQPFLGAVHSFFLRGPVGSAILGAQQNSWSACLLCSAQGSSGRLRRFRDLQDFLRPEGARLKAVPEVEAAPDAAAITGQNDPTSDVWYILSGRNGVHGDGSPASGTGRDLAGPEGCRELVFLGPGVWALGGWVVLRSRPGGSMHDSRPSLAAQGEEGQTTTVQGRWRSRHGHRSDPPSRRHMRNR